MIFYVDSLKFELALLNSDKPECAVRTSARLGMTSWVKAKRGNQPLRPLTVKRIADALGVLPASIIKCDANGYSVEAVISA